MTAQTVATWTGGGANANWGTTLNWSGSAPANSTTRAFVFEGATALSNTNTLTSATASSITFNSAGFTLAGNALTLADTGSVTLAATGTQTISLPLSLPSNAQRLISGTGGAWLVLNGNVTGLPNADFRFQRLGTTGRFTVTLAGSSAFGTNSLSEIIGSNVTLNFASPNALGSGTLSFGAASGNVDNLLFDNTSGSPLTIATNLALTRGPTGGSVPATTGFVGTHDLTTTGTLTAYTGSRGLFVQKSTLTVGGVEGTQTSTVLIKAGTGTLRIAGPSFTTGVSAGISINDGTVAVAHPLALGSSTSGTLGFGDQAVAYQGPSHELVIETDLTGTNRYRGTVFLGDSSAVTATISGGFGATFGNLVNERSSAVLANNLTSGTLRFDGRVAITSSTNTTGLAGTINFSGPGVTILSGTIGEEALVNPGVGSLIKSGTGTLQILTSATYRGTTRVDAGLLVLTTTAAITGTATRPYTVNAPATLTTGFGLDQIIPRIAVNSAGVLALGTSSGTNLNFSSLNSASLGAVGPGSLAYSGVLTPNASSYRIGGGGGTLDFQSTLTGTQGLVLGGDATGRGGTVLLTTSTANTFTGKTTLQRGSVEIASLADSGTTNPSSLGAPSAANATIDVGSVGGSGTQTLRYVGTGHSTNRTLNLLNASGGFTLDASGSGSVAFTGGVTNANGITFTLTGSSTNANFITAVTGSNVVKTGPGTWVFGTNSFTGQLAVQQGTIIAAMNAPGGSGTTSSLGKQNGPIPVIGLANTTGTAALLAGNGVTISRVIEVAALGSGSQEVVLGGSEAGEATFDANTAFRLGRGVTLAADPGGNVRFLTSTANWNQQDGSADPAVAVTIGTPTATGTVTLETTLPNSITAVTVRQGTLRLGNGTTIGALGPASVLTGSAGATLAFDRSDTITSGVHFAAAIGGAMNVRQQGSGTVTLAGVNTYTGATDVVAGTLEVDGVLGNTTVTVAAGATLSGTGTIGGPTTILGTHAPGSSPGIETFANGLTYGATSTLIWELMSNTEAAAARGILFDGVDLTGAALSIVSGATLSLVFDLPGSTVDWSDAFWGTNRSWTVIDVAGGSWDSSLFTTLQVGVDSTSATLASKRAGSSFQIVDLGGDLVLEYVVVPEPGALALAAIGIAAVWGVRRRR